MQLEHPNLGGECAQCPTGSVVPVLKSYLYFTKSYLKLTILIITSFLFGFKSYLKSCFTQLGPTLNVKMVLLVDQIIVQLHLVLTLKLIVVIHALVLVEFLAGKEITIVMMKTTIVDVNGMEETVVVVM